MFFKTNASSTTTTTTTTTTTVGRASSVKVFSLNVHSWTSPDREPLDIIDQSVCGMVENLQPDISCFQEVKHPHPCEPVNGQNLVRITANDRTLFRYGDDESNESIRERLVIPEDYGTLDSDEQQFLENREYRNAKRYLDCAFPYQSKISCKPTKTSLAKIAESMGVGAENIHFKPAHSTTFGNAVIYKTKGVVESTNLKVHGKENRAATKVIIDTGHHWDFAVVNLHLDHLQEDVRIDQMKILLDWLSGGTGTNYLPHILVGDFNAVSYWTQEVLDSRARANLPPSTDALFKFLSQYGYVDLEKESPPRTTSIYNVRVDYIFCSPMLLPRIRMEDTHFDVIASKSDHSAIFGRIELNQEKLLLGVVVEDEEQRISFPDHLKHMMTEKGVGGTIEVVRDLSGLVDTFTRSDCVIVVVNNGNDAVAVLPSLDFLFHVDCEVNIAGVGEKEQRKMFRISSAVDAFEIVEGYIQSK